MLPSEKSLAIGKLKTRIDFAQSDLYRAMYADSTFAVSSSQRLSKVGRNESCPCGSGKKYKKCHGVNC